MLGLETPAGYTITRRLGSDASAMYLAREDATGASVTLRFVGQVGPQVRDRLRLAAQALRAVDHPHVIPFLDVVDGPGGVVVVLGAAEGGSLAGIIGARGVLPAGEVVTACAPVAEGLAEVHRRGIVHGDLTLDDLVFSLDGRPMVAGVGLVQTGVPLRVGQRARPVPPEVQAGSPPGPPADVYGLVTAAVVALTGYLPSARLSLPAVPPATQALLASALDPVPNRRPPVSSIGNVFFAVADPAPVELVLEENHATTGTMRPVLDAPVMGADDDVAAFMRRSTATGRRARRRSESADAPEVLASGAVGGMVAPAGAGPTTVPGGAGVSPTAPTGPISTPRRGRRGRSEEPPPPSGPRGGIDDGVNVPVPEGVLPDDRRPGRRPAPAKSAAAPPAKDSRRGGGRGAPPPSSDDVDTGGPKRKDRLWIVSTLVALLVVAGVAIVGWSVFGDDTPTDGPGSGSSPGAEVSTDLCGGPQPAPSVPPPTVTDWTQEVQRLYTLRAQAFEEGDPELLCQVHSPTNPTLTDDAETLEEYADADVHTDGLVFEVVNAELVSQEGGRARVTITQRTPPYTLVNEDGNVEQEMEGFEEQTWEADLVAVANPDGTSSWRFG
ncbi:serine/threonine protein kinase [Jiangella endophytica]|uniref:serine/threonine protein kinase n=1 Tax=Jiangella endophytica TaxID=1623398 RepID=UPI000E347268|nr:protein kinase [Jiangella endophytica]